MSTQRVHSRQWSVASILRLGVALAIATAVIATVVEASLRTVVNPFNLFGYFTIQSNIILAVVFGMAVGAGVQGRAGTDSMSLLRACATTYIGIVGIVYAVLLAPLGAAGGVPIPWANAVLHIVTPLYAVLDWLVFTDRAPVPLRRLWVVLLYPLIWVVVVVIRGATDGWFPYPFLDPANGYGSVGVYVAIIMVTMLVVGALVFWASTIRRGGDPRTLRIPVR